MTKISTHVCTLTSKLPFSRGEARRRAMMDAAWQAVLEKGFSATTLDDIISRSGGSRSTLYSAFGDKDGLLKAVMQEKCDAFSAELSLTLNAEQDPEQALYRFGEMFAEKIVEDEVLRFTHLMIAEGHMFPKLLQGFLCGGPQRTDQRLMRYLREVAAAGKLAIPDAELAADLLLGMLIGRWTEAVQSSLLAPPEREAYKMRVRTRAKAAIAMFLAATRPKA